MPFDHDYFPWSAEFTDGTYISRLGNPNIPFSKVRERSALLRTFYIHFDWNDLIGVSLITGLFYKGTRPGDPNGWSAHPNHQKKANRELVYYRKCEGSLVGTKFVSQVKSYVMGWEPCLVLIDPSRNFTWVT